jgi:hypothetical protein
MIRNDTARFARSDGAAELEDAGRSPMKFKILEFKGTGSAQATEIGHRYSTRDEAMSAIKVYLKKFKASGRNPEGDYWWARDAEGLRKCWISSID